MAAPVLAIVIPCYNDSEALPISVARLTAILDRLIVADRVAEESYLLCVDDGSTDDTWAVISDLHERDTRIKGVALAHNRGQQYALIAGLTAVNGKCDAAVTIDADLQDDPEAIVAMTDLFLPERRSYTGSGQAGLPILGLSVLPQGLSTACSSDLE